MSTEDAVPRNRRRLIVGVTVAAVLVFVAGYVAFGRSPSSLKGPDGETTNGLYMNVDAVATWGSLLLWNTGDNPVVLEDLTLNSVEGTRDGVKILRLQVVPTDKLGETGGIGMSAKAGDHVIPEAWRSPLNGYRLKPGAEVSVLVQYQALKKGAWSFETVTVDYRERWRSGHLTLRQALAVCVPDDVLCDLETSG